MNATRLESGVTNIGTNFEYKCIFFDGLAYESAILQESKGGGYGEAVGGKGGIEAVLQKRFSKKGGKSCVN